MNRQHTSRTPALLFALILSPMLFADTGLIVTIAGTGIDGSAGIGGPAVNAQLGPAFGMAVDAADNLFIAGNNRVVRVDAATGILTLVAGNGAASSTGDGGPAALAAINVPFAVALDGAGNLYIAEEGGNRIRRVDAQTGIITTVAGTGSAGFSGDGGPATSATLFLPAGIALDSAQNLYIADAANFRVRRVDAQTGIITTVVGNGSNAVTADGGPAAGASLAHPMWVAFDGSGGLLISEWGANRIRRVDPLTGILTTVAGNGDANFTGDGVAATSAGIGGPIELLTDAAGNLFFADGTGRVRRVDAATGVITTVAGNGSGPHGMSSASAGGGGGGGGAVSRCIGTATGDYGPATGATLDSPLGVQLTRNGNLLVSDSLDCRVRRVYLPSPYLYTNTTLTASATTLQGGQGVLLTATVSPIGVNGVATGGIQFVDAPPFFSSTVLGVAALDGGTASLVVSTLSQGGHQIQAYYSGDSALNSSGSPGIPISVSGATKAIATVTLSANQNPAPGGTATIFTATVTPPVGDTTALSGPVVLYDGSTVAAMTNVGSGTAQLSVMFMTRGNHPMTAVYLGDNNYSQAFSATMNVAAKDTSSITVVSSSNPSLPSVGFMVTVTPAWATGAVQLLDGSTPLGSSTLMNGVAYFSISNLTPGPHPIQAVYSGDSSFIGSSSAILTQTVNGPTTVSLTSSAPSFTYGQASLYTVSVVPASATGFIQIMVDGSPAISPAPLTNGTLVVAAPPLSAGSHTITAVYTGDSNTLPGTSAPLPQTIAKATPAITLASQVNPSSYMQTVTFTGSCTPITPGASVALLDGLTLLATLTTTPAGAFTYSPPTLPIGGHPMTAACGGDSNVFPGVSALLVQTVQSSTLVALSAPGPFTYGQPITFTAAVSANAATGVMQFSEGGTTLGTPTLSGGQASVTVPWLPAGTHLIVATYQGDGIYLTSNTALSIQVAKVGANTTLTSSLNPSTVGQPLTLSAAVSPASATGTVQFLDGAASLGTASVGGGSAALAIASLSPGAHSITAVYSGDANTAASTAAAVTQNVSKAASSVTLTSSLNPSTNGQSVTFTATVLPVSASGTVQFQDGSTVLGTVTMSGGSAALVFGALAQGTHSITASYSGDANNAASASSVLTQTIAAAIPQPVSVTPSGDTGNPGLFTFVFSDTDGWTNIVSTGILFNTSVSPANGCHVVFEPGNNRFYLADDGETTLLGPVTLGALQILENSQCRISGASSTAAEGPGSYLSVTLAISFKASFAGAKNIYLEAQSPYVQGAWQQTGSWTITAPQAPAAPSAPSPGDGSTGASFSPVLSWTAGAGAVWYEEYLGTVPDPPFATRTMAVEFSPGPLTPGTRYYWRVISRAAAGDTSSPVWSFTTAPAPTSLALTSSLNPSVMGQPVAFTATVSSNTATGTVQFLDGTTALGAATISGGSAALAVTSLTAGAHSITAVYSGDSNYASSTAAAMTQTISRGPSSVSLTSTPNPSLALHVFLLTANVLPGTATGSVQFLDGTTVLGMAYLSGGSASISPSTLTVGTHPITAVYSGDFNYAPSTSAALTQTVSKTAINVSLTSSPNPAPAQQVVALMVTLSATVATGTIQFMEGTTVLGTATLNLASTAITLSTLAVGTHSITAVYSGDSNFLSTTSAAMTQTIVKASAGVTLTSSPNPSPFQQAFALMASVSPNTATGTVQFKEGTTVLGTATLSGGLASIAPGTLPVGTHSITAVYSGDGNYLASTSAVLAESIVKGSSSATLTSSLNPSISGKNVTFAAMVSPSSATGTVQFLDGSTVLGTVTITDGPAALSRSNLAIGAHTITAVYSGDGNYTASTSGPLTQTVSAPPPGAPANLTARAGSSSQINLSWSASPTNGVTYDIYSAATSGLKPLASNRIASGVSGTSYSNSGLPASTTRYYVVTAQKASVESVASNQATATTRK
jgi:sugar lactone lactonase YvrE